MFELKCKRLWKSTLVCAVDFYYLMWKCWTSQVVDEYNGLDSLSNCVEQMTYDMFCYHLQTLGLRTNCFFLVQH
jgi:hypothetical protein